MKIRKRAIQKNFPVNSWYYSDYDYSAMTRIDGVEYLGDRIVVYSHYVDEIKVVVDEMGFYTNVVVMKTGEKIFVEL